MRRGRSFFHRWTNYEYWPTWAFYAPVLVLWPLLSLRGRSLLFFTSANPCIPHGGCFGESKMDILRLLPLEVVPQTILVGAQAATVLPGGWSFPVIAKPDVGERGAHVTIVQSAQELEVYARELGRPFLVQEYLSLRFEAGVMVERDPLTNRVRVTSIVTKDFLTVTGDGTATVTQLMERDPRAAIHAARLGSDCVLERDETLILEPIGNHCRGTRFVNGADLRTAALEDFFTQLVHRIPEFYVGRFDLKAPDRESFRRAEGIKVMELNGVFSEPGHVYDQSVGLPRAWRDLVVHWWAVARLGQLNRKRGHGPTPFLSFASLFFSYKGLQQSGSHA